MPNKQTSGRKHKTAVVITVQGMIRFSCLLLSPLVALTACTESPNDAHHHGHEHPELAEAMSRMQYYSQKLGYAIQAENDPLADFYLHELEELSERVIEEIPTYEAHEIGRLTEQVMLPALHAQHEALEHRDWPAAREAYDRLIMTCNACHQMTDHPFIHITPAHGDPPFNQRFEPINDEHSTE